MGPRSNMNISFIKITKNRWRSLPLTGEPVPVVKQTVTRARSGTPSVPTPRCTSGSFPGQMTVGKPSLAGAIRSRHTVRHVEKVSIFIAVRSKALRRIVSTNACNQVPRLPTSYALLREPSNMLTNKANCVHVTVQLLSMNRRCNIWT